MYANNLRVLTFLELLIQSLIHWTGCQPLCLFTSHDCWISKLQEMAILKDGINVHLWFISSLRFQFNKKLADL